MPLEKHPWVNPRDEKTFVPRKNLHRIPRRDFFRLLARVQADYRLKIHRVGYGKTVHYLYSADNKLFLIKETSRWLFGIKRTLYYAVMGSDITTRYHHYLFPRREILQ